MKKFIYRISIKALTLLYKICTNILRGIVNLNNKGGL